MSPPEKSLEGLIAASARALIIGVGGGGDVVGALAAGRFVEFCGLPFALGGLSWERRVFDPIPGPRKLSEVENVRAFHEYGWMANSRSHTAGGVFFAESKMAAALGKDVLLIDINGGVKGAVGALEAAMHELDADLLLGLDVGGDSLAQGGEPGLRSPLADSIMLASFAELEERGRRTLWGVFGYGSDGELSVDEIELALARLAAAGGLLGAWGLTEKTTAELEEIIKTVPTEASAVPVRSFRGVFGKSEIRGGERTVKLTPLATLTFFIATRVLYETLSRPARAVHASDSLEAANNALHAIGVKTELDLERERYRAC